MAEEQQPRSNPFRNEADAFRMLTTVVIAGAIVVAVTLLLGTTPGFILAVIFFALAAWKAADWARYWLGTRADGE